MLTREERDEIKIEYTRVKKAHPDLNKLMMSEYTKVFDSYVAFYLFCNGTPQPTCEICGTPVSIAWRLPRRCITHANYSAETAYTHHRLISEVPGVYKPWEGELALSDHVEIWCDRHGWYRQIIRSRVAGLGCQKCYLEDKRGKYRIDHDQYMSEFKRIHGDRYDYSRVVFSGAETKIEIGCPDHGYFWQAANVHRSGHGCMACAREVSIPRLIERAMANLKPGKTKDTKPELAFKVYLDARDIAYDHQYTVRFHIPGQPKESRATYDFHIPSKNLIVEIDGEYWHTSHAQARRDKFKTHLALSAGYLILRISDLDMRFELIDATIEEIKSHNTKLIESREGKLR